MSRLNVMPVTVSRADYGILYPLLKKISKDDFFDLNLVVTGSHLSPLHGETIKNIEKDGFDVSDRVVILPVDETEKGVCSSIADGIKGFAEVFESINPDLVIVLGDRFELLSICPAAVVNRIPIAHIHGGEVTYGAIDDSIRHSVTKMASIHFPSIEAYGHRIVQMGENPERVHVVGALGIDNIKNTELMDKIELSEYTGMDFNSKVALVTYHPVTLDHYKMASLQVGEVLEAMMTTDLSVLITMPNTDAGGISIYETIKKHIGLYPQKFKLVKNLGQRAYLSAMKHSEIMIGNSSSGIIESASFKIPVVNIGDRQAGRFKPANVIDCDCSKDSIVSAVNKALSKEHRDLISKLKNPYGDGNTAERIVDVLKSIDFKDRSGLLKKRFFDLTF